MEINSNALQKVQVSALCQKSNQHPTAFPLDQNNSSEATPFSKATQKRLTACDLSKCCSNYNYKEHNIQQPPNFVILIIIICNSDNDNRPSLELKLVVWDNLYLHLTSMRTGYVGRGPVQEQFSEAS